jgi:hypothetical protein
MLLGSGGTVIIEVVNNQGVTVAREVNVKLQEQGDDSAWSWVIGR